VARVAHVIEPAKSGRSKCQSCGAPIATGELRLAEAYVPDQGRWAQSHKYARSPRPRDMFSYDDDDRRDYDDQNPDVWERFHHLACAAQHQPFKLRSALAACKLELADRGALEQAIARAVAVLDTAEENEATRDEYLSF